MSEKITEQTITLEELQASDVGGNLAQRLDPKDVKDVLKYIVKDVTGVKTEWGIRIEFVVSDDYADYKFSSWNIVSKAKIKPLELVGKQILISPYKANPKKMLLELA